MAETAVKFAIDTLSSLLIQEVNLLGGVKKEIEGIKSELESLRSFLQDADARAASEQFGGGGGGNEGVKTWVKQVREKAYNIEDVIDEYILMVSKLPHGSGLVTALRKIGCLMKKAKMCHGVASEIAGIKSSLADIKRRAERYSFRSTDEGSSSGKTIDVVPHDSRVGSYFIEDDEVVGIESSRDKLIDWLVNGTFQRSVVAMVGEGGVGKTTLAGKIFNNEAVKAHFSCQAWVTVGKECSKSDLLRTIIKKFSDINQELVPGGIDKMEERDLINMLRENLKDKTYMVVFDDVWKVDFWGDIEHALLDNKKCSRIVLTTRRMNVADYCKSSSFVQVHEVETLPPNEAWKLFCRKAFGASSKAAYCPPELKELSIDILAKCGGLPLAIVAVGGLLSTKNKMVAEWQKLLDGLGSKLGNDPYLKDCNRVLSEGYYDLPHHLKSCLLYFGLFPESHRINCARFMRLWIAEGFVQYSVRPTSEQIAEEYLNELIDRSLVQVTEKDISGRSRVCLVHDLMYEIIIRKAEELGFCRVLNKDNMSHCRSTRRISIYGITCGVFESIKESKARSVFLFNVNNKLPETFMDTLVNNFKIMKVLELQDAPIDYLPDGVGNLFHLHYLSLKDTNVKTIPKSIGRLLNLETLDLKRSRVTELPVEIRNLKKLRYLLVYYSDGTNYYGEGAKIHEGLGFLTDLQKLSFVQASSATLKELRKLKQLKKLGFRLTNGNGKDLCAMIANLENLESLDIHSRSTEEILDIQSLVSPPPYLQRLQLKGNIKKLPDWIFELKNLIRITLIWSGLKDDPIGILQALPSLLELRLRETYNYEYMHFKEGWFPKLQKLYLWDFKSVKLVVIEKGAMPDLRELRIRRCPLLSEIPTGIEHLRNLRFLLFINMLRQVYVMTKDKTWEEVTRHIPEIRVSLILRSGNGVYRTAKFMSSLSLEDFDKFFEALTPSRSSHICEITDIGVSSLAPGMP